MAAAKLATELDETIRQTREMVSDLNDALIALLDTALSDAEARLEATQRMLVGLQAQDRIEQRCTNINSAIDQMRRIGTNFSEQKSNEVWKSLTLDELANPQMSGVSKRVSNGDVDMF